MRYGGEMLGRPARHSNLPGLPARIVRHREPPLSLPVHQLRRLWTAVRDPPRATVQSRQHDDVGPTSVRSLPGRVRRRGRTAATATRRSPVRIAARRWSRTTRQAGSQATGASALEAATRFLRAGGVLAVKGFGGYSLIASAVDAEAVGRLRRLDERPPSVVFPTLESIEALCDVSAIEKDALTSTAAPIVLLRGATSWTKSCRRRCRTREANLTSASPFRQRLCSACCSRTSTLRWRSPVVRRAARRCGPTTGRPWIDSTGPRGCSSFTISSSRTRCPTR